MKLFALLLAAAVTIAAAPATVKVQVNRRVIEVPLEKYVAAVLAGEASVFRSDEALKAMSVAARTYAIRMRGRHQAEGFDFCVTTHCQRVDLDGANTNLRFQKIAAGTAGELLWYRGKLAFTPYSLDCGGRTEDVSAVWPDEAAPYLRSRPDEFCMRAGASDWHWTGDAAAIANALRKQRLNAPAHLTGMRISERTASGRAHLLQLSGDGAVPISASAFRFAIGRELGWNTLRSDRFDAHSAAGKISFDGRGSGHGVG
ncbi:MAG TPA: SpoIID/LytB domain-containing protein, partial [Bryobacteraceae bacterium]|nr:SpoIID/LytB domain-containing protein [Bryobacteraceae bacterium]